MAEVLSKRTRYQKVFDDPPGENQYRAEVHAGGVHFLGDDDQWHDMDGLIVNGETQAKDIKYSFVSQHGGFRKDGKYLGFKPTALLLLDASTGDTYEVETATVGTPVLTGNSMDLEAVFTDTDMRVDFSEFTMAKWWNIATRPTLPDPVSLGMDPDTTYLVWAYSKKTTGGQVTLTDRAQGQEWDGSLLLGEIGVEDRNGTELCWFRQGSGTSATVRGFDVHYVVPNGHDFGEAVAYSSIQAATYPLIVDPSTTVYAGTEDGTIEGGSTVNTAQGFGYIGRVDAGKGAYYTYRYYCRFDLSSLSGNTCDSATLKLYGHAKSGNASETYTAKLYTTDWGPTLTSGDHGQAGTNQGSVAGSAFTVGQYNDWSLTAANIEDKFGGYASFELYSSDETYSGARYISVRSANRTGTAQDPKMSITYTEGGGGDVTVGKDSLSVTGQAPTLSLGWNGTVGADTLAISGKQPVVTATDGAVDSDVTVGLDTLSVTGLQPVVTTTTVINSDVVAGAGSLAIAGQQPTVTTTDTVAVTAGADALAITGQQPTVTATTVIDSDVTVGADAISITGQQPTVSLGDAVNVSVGADALTLTGQQPTVTATTVIDSNVTVGADALTIAGQQPTVTATTVIDSDVTVGADSLTISGQQVTPLIGDVVSVTVGADSLTVAGQQPVVTTTSNVAVTAGADAITIAGQQPTVTAVTVIDSDVTVGLDTLSISGLQPTVTANAGAQITVGADAITISGKQASLVLDQQLQVGVGAISVTGQTPSVTASGLAWTCETLGTGTWSCETLPSGLVYLVDGDGNYIIDGDGNYIVVGEGSTFTDESLTSGSWTEESI